MTKALELRKPLTNEALRDMPVKQVFSGRIVWTVSTKRETEGYNVATLYIGNKRVASCNGGGYDMNATVFGSWLEETFADRLNLLDLSSTSRRGSRGGKGFYGLTYNDPDFDPGKVLIGDTDIDTLEAKGISLGLDRIQAEAQAASDVPTPSHRVPSIDGACGMSSVDAIAEAIGLSIARCRGGRPDDDVVLYTIEDRWPDAP